MTPRIKGKLADLILPKFRVGDHVWVQEPEQTKFKAIIRSIAALPEPQKGFECTVVVPGRVHNNSQAGDIVHLVNENLLEQVTYEPLQIACCESGCKVTFTLSREGQKFYFEKGYVLPKRCKDCRDRKKTAGDKPKTAAG